MAITDEDAEIVEERHFDAWGDVAWIKDDSGNNIDELTVLDRGYTGHEHLQDVKLIHMNGRLYDPVLRRFLAPDNYVQDPYNTQNFNRYGYVYNNPLMFNDPSGEWLLEAIGIVGAIVSGAIIIANAIWGDHDPPQNDTANQNTGVNTHTSNAGGSSGSIASSMASFHEGVGSHSYSLPNGIRSFNFSNYTTNTIAYSQMQDINKGFSPYNDKPAQQGSGFGVSLLDGFQTVLDVVGLVPVVGEIADGANALIYLGRGDYGNAGLSAAAMIPFAGWGATGTKLALKGKKAFDAAKSSGAGKYLFNNWHKGTFANRTQSVSYHLAKHGKGRTATQYTQDAMNFFNKNKGLGQNVILKDGTQGIKIQTKQIINGKTHRVGGYWTRDGKLVTFWD